jgi:hypothetical protein
LIIPVMTVSLRVLLLQYQDYRETSWVVRSDEIFELTLRKRVKIRAEMLEEHKPVEEFDLDTQMMFT